MDKMIVVMKMVGHSLKMLIRIMMTRKKVVKNKYPIKRKKTKLL